MAKRIVKGGREGFLGVLRASRPASNPVDLIKLFRGVDVFKHIGSVGKIYLSAVVLKNPAINFSFTRIKICFKAVKQGIVN